MDAFNTLMMIFIGLVLVNVILTLGLWRATRSKMFCILFFHWNFTLAAFYTQKNLAMYATPLWHALGLIPLNFFVHMTLNAVYASVLKLDINWKKFLVIPFLSILGILVVYQIFGVSKWVFFPGTFFHSMIYYIIVTKAMREKRKEMTFSLKCISFLMLVFGTHLFTYTFFQEHLNLLVIGFAIALALMTGISILFPAAIIEQLTRENYRLINEIELKAKLAQSTKMVALGEMAEGIAHEINNPLMIMSLMLDKARFSIEDRDFETLHGQIARAQKSAKRMSKIVKGLLEFSSEDEKEEFVLINAQKLIEDTLELCSEKISQRSVELKFFAPERSINFIGQKIQLSQVLLNLINNAFDAATEADEKWIKLDVEERSEEVIFTVTDSGPGFTEEARSKLFQPFFTTKDIGKGTGLGLSIAHGIVERHRGKIFLDLTSPQTKVVVILPKFQFVKR